MIISSWPAISAFLTGACSPTSSRNTALIGNRALAEGRAGSSGGHRGELVAQMPGAGGQASQLPTRMGLLLGRKDRQLKGLVIGQQVPDDARILVGHGRDGLRRPHPGA